MDVFAVRLMAQQLLKEIDRYGEKDDDGRFHQAAQLVTKATTLVREGPSKQIMNQAGIDAVLTRLPASGKFDPAVDKPFGAAVPTVSEVGFEPPGSGKALQAMIDEKRAAWEAAGRPTETLTKEQEALLAQGNALNAGAIAAKHAVVMETSSDPL